ncbi:hypothetical protein RHSIM_Rhsim02G0085500 [Rhododendron simsii]|uniref:Uncharacterized protein n=1 Tax=Rhododendron simsii TaxID=118357 RepID=A0A834LYC2_RHOSS|nr:hypothetical protein RHSIM_Rhsim02G0085500 [Rhododendron simsii]
MKLVLDEDDYAVQELDKAISILPSIKQARESYSCFNWLLKILNGIKGFIDAAVLASPDCSRLDSLLDNMSCSLSDQKSSAKTLRWLTDEYPPYRDLLGNNEAVSKLLEPLAVPGNACLDLHLQGDIIATVLNISLPEGNKKVVAENSRVIPLLIDALRTGTTMTKGNAAAALSKGHRPNSRNAKKPTPTELTKELEKLLMLILNEDDYAVQQLNKAICILSSLKENNARGNETTEEATRVILSLRELKIKESVPKEFKRPTSREITGDPVVVASGQDLENQEVRALNIFILFAV